MKDLIKRLRPDCFEDMIALVALFRPGPLQSGMVDNFIDRKHGVEEISYPDVKWQHESFTACIRANLWCYLVSRASDADCTGTCRLYLGWRGYVTTRDG